MNNSVRTSQRVSSGWMIRVICLVVSVFAFAAFRGCEEKPTEEIEFWTISLRPNFTEYIRERIGVFEAERPGVRVRWVDVPFSAIERKLLASAAAGRAPDVVNLSDMMFARFAAAGAFTDLSNLLTPEELQRYHAGALGVGRLLDQQLALPWYLTTQAMIINQNLLERGGLTLETVGRTWGELLEQAGPFQQRTGAFLFTQPLGTDSQLPMMLLADGLSPFRVNEHGLLAADLTRPEIVQFIRSWVEVYRSGAMPREAATSGFEHLIEVYQNERVAVLNTGANFLGRVRDVSRSVYDSSVVLPPITGYLEQAHIAVMPICVSAKSSNPQLAADFAAFITSPQSQLEFCRLAAILPSTPESLEDPFFEGPTEQELADGLGTLGQGRATVVQALRHASPFTPPIEAWPEMRNRFNERIKAALLEGADVEQTLRLIERDWQLSLDRMNERRIASGGRPAGVEVFVELQTRDSPMPSSTDKEYD